MVMRVTSPSERPDPVGAPDTVGDPQRPCSPGHLFGKRHQYALCGTFTRFTLATCDDGELCVGCVEARNRLGVWRRYSHAKQRAEKAQRAERRQVETL